MLDMSWGEVLVIGGVALLVIPPKDLPKAMRTVGQMMGKVRRLAAEFQGQFAEAMREAELDDVKRQIQGVNESVGSFNPMQTIRNELKGAIEAPVAASEKTPGEPDAAVREREEAHPSGPVEPTIALAAASVPPVVDPAESIAEAIRQSAVGASPEGKPEAAEFPAGKQNERSE